MTTRKPARGAEIESLDAGDHPPRAEAYMRLYPQVTGEPS